MNICVGSALGKKPKKANPIAPQVSERASSLGVLVGDIFREAR